MNHKLQRTSVWQPLLAVFMTAVLINYPWEMAQAPLFAEMASSMPKWLHCFIASLGDGLLVVLILLAGWIAFGRQDWFHQPGVRGYLLMMASGFVIGIGVEWAAVHVRGAWSYTKEMPVLPGLGIGAVPVVQMLLLPPLIFRLVGLYRRQPASN